MRLGIVIDDSKHLKCLESGEIFTIRLFDSYGLKNGDTCEFELIDVPKEFGFIDNNGTRDMYPNDEGLNDIELMDLEYAEVVSEECIKIAKIKI